MGRIFHVTTESDWQAGLREGRYTTSTRGRTLAEEGFIHASRADQWQDVRRRWYGDVSDPLVLLVIDTDRLEAPVIAEAAPGADETFPHIYGPLNLNAVVQAVPLASSGEEAPAEVDGFSSVFLREVFRNAVLGLALLLLVATGVGLGRLADPDWGPWLGLVLGLGCGVWLIRVANRGRRASPTSRVP